MCEEPCAETGGRTVTILGLTFKENVSDIRNSRIVDIISGLKDHAVSVQVVDPLAVPAEVLREYGIVLTPLEKLEKADAVILAVPHREFLREGWALIMQCLAPGAYAVVDVRGALPRDRKPEAVTLWRL